MSKITVVSTMRNEAQILPFWLRHYEQVADKIIVYDHHSTDATVRMLVSHPLVELRRYEPQEFDDGHYAEFINHITSDIDSDWIIVVDADEFIYPVETIREYLDYYDSKGITLPHLQGYSMMSPEFPDYCDTWQLTNYVQLGVKDDTYSKYAIFHRDVKIGYQPGRHGINPRGRVVIGCEFNIKLLHYRYFGRQWLAERNARNASGLSDRARGMGWGWHVQPEHQHGRYSAEWYEAQPVERVIP